jgi:hypothetical protein
MGVRLKRLEFAGKGPGPASGKKAEATMVADRSKCELLIDLIKYLNSVQSLVDWSCKIRAIT